MRQEKESKDKNNKSKEQDQTWLEEAEERLDRAVEKLDTKFPLSGAAKDKDLELFSDEDNNEDGDFKDREHLDTNFPLSGGES